MARLDGMLDVCEILSEFTDHGLGGYRGCRWRFTADCLLSNFGHRFVIYMPPKGVGLRLRTRLNEFPISDVLNLGLEGL